MTTGNSSKLMVQRYARITISCYLGFPMFKANFFISKFSLLAKFAERICFEMSYKFGFI